jgi:hypothetical protein
MNAFELVISEVSPHLESLEALRLTQRKKKTFWLLGFFGISVLLLFMGIAMAELLIAGLIFFVVFGIVVIAVCMNITKKYKKTYKDVVITPLIKAINPNLSYYKDSCIAKEKFIASKIFLTHPDRYTGEDYVAGMVDKTMIEFSELHAQYRSTDGKGHTQYHTFFKGLFLIADFNKNFNGRTVVLPDSGEKTFGFLSKVFQKMNVMRDQLVYMEDPVFENNFKVYSSDQVEARYILSPDFMSRIVELKLKFDKKIYFSFMDSKVCLTIYTSYDYFNPHMSQSALNTDVIRGFYNEINILLSIVDDLNLNTRIWSKQ